MPAERLAPVVSPEEQRRARLNGILSQFGIDVEKLDKYLRNPLMNVGTPMEQARVFFVPRSPQDRGEVAEALAGAAIGGSDAIARKCMDAGLAAFCGSDEEAMRFLGTVLQAYSRLEGEQAISKDTISWLTRVERDPDSSGALSRTILSGMSLQGQRKWLEDNFDAFSRAAVFQAWAKERGIEQPTIDEAGRALFGEIWDYASAVGLYLKFENGAWKLHGSRGGEEATTSLALDALRRLAPVSAPSRLAAIPVRMAEAPQEKATPLQEFGDFYARTGERMFSGGVLTVLSYETRDGWLRNYIRNYESGLSHEQRLAMQRELREATAFYVWAKNIRGLEEGEIERAGAERYGRLWALARTVGENLKESAERAGVYILPRENVSNVRLAFGMVEGRESERVALAPVPAEVPAVAAAAPAAAERVALADTEVVRRIADTYGVSAGYVVEAAGMLLSGRRISLRFEATSERPVGHRVSGNSLIYNFGPDVEFPFIKRVALKDSIENLARSMRGLGLTTTARLSPGQQAELSARMA